VELTPCINLRPLLTGDLRSRLGDEIPISYRAERLSRWHSDRVWTRVEMGVRRFSVTNYDAATDGLEKIRI
jgi:hypothetical protein